MPINYQKTYDTLSYEEGIAFRDLTMEVIKEIYPHYRVEPFEPQNPDVILVTNQEDNIRVKCGLRDLYVRFSNTARTRSDLKETILNDYSHILKQLDDLDLIEEEMIEPEWMDICDYVQPRLKSMMEFGDELELYVHFPFGSDLVTTFVIVMPEDEGFIKQIRVKLLEKWDITVEDLYKRAMENFADYSEGLELVGTGKPHANLWNEKGYEYAATTILLGGMRYVIAQTIGSPFRFGIPSSHAVFCWAELEDKDFQIKMKAEMKRKFDTMPARLTENIFEVDEKGQIKQVKDLPDLPETSAFSNN